MFYDTISLEAITALPIKVKESFPEESKKWDALTSAVIDAWGKFPERYLTINGKKYKLEEIKI